MPMWVASAVRADLAARVHADRGPTRTSRPSCSASSSGPASRSRLPGSRQPGGSSNGRLPNPTSSTRSATPTTTGPRARTSSAATRTTGRCRSTTSSGPSSATAGRGRSTPASTPRWRKRRQRDLTRSPAEGLKTIGIDPSKVEDVIITHMHYDHAGNHTLFPNARFHLQDARWSTAPAAACATPPCAIRSTPRTWSRWCAGCTTDTCAFHDGDDELAPGLSVHHVGGHTMGLQVVRVWTRRGWVVLASDASHFYANMDAGPAIPGRLQRRRHARGPQALLAARELGRPRHPRPRSAGAEALSGARPELEGWIVRVDAEPKRA